MKNLKNWWMIAALAFSLVFTMTACGSGGDEGTTAAEEETAFATSELKAELTMGELKDNVYANESLGMEIDPGSAWKDVTQKTRDNMLENFNDLSDFSAETFRNDEDFRKTAENGYNLPLVNWESTSAGEIELKIKGVGAESDVKEYIDSAYNTTVESYGDEYEFSEPTPVEMGGVEWYGYSFDMDVLGYTVTSGSYIHNYGDYSATLTISISDMGGDSYDKVLKYFKAL